MMYLTIFVFRNGLQDGVSTFELWPSACSRNDCGQFHYLYSVVIIVSDLSPSFMDRILSSFSIFKLILHPALFPDIANRPGTGQSGSSNKAVISVVFRYLQPPFLFSRTKFQILRHLIGSSTNICLHLQYYFIMFLYELCVSIRYSLLT